MKLYAKILLTFGLVIAIAVLAVAIAVGRRAEVEFRTYHTLYSQRAQTTADALIAYYAAHDGWAGLQAQLTDLIPGERRGAGGQGAGPGATKNTPSGWDYRVADASRQIVADASWDIGTDVTGQPTGKLSTSEARYARPLELDGAVIGYMALNAPIPLDEPAQQFVDSLRDAVWIGISVALLLALVTAGLLARGIVAPVRSLTQAAQEIATGDLETRAPIRSKDEIGTLAETFNAMAAHLEQTEAARRAQIADISHELRNPLSVLQGSLEALADGIYRPTPENLQPALDQVRTLNRLVEDLHTLALTEAGALRLEIQPVEVNAFLTGICEAFQETFAAHALTLRRENAARPLTAMADLDRLRQVINNILQNALRYVPAGSEVVITAAPADDGVMIQIADDGPGIPEAHMPHLFERFWRGDPSRSRETGGAGLGLTIARQIVEAHGGRIAAAPTPGGGLTLRIWLPGPAG
jgi:two-component system sensor histidine kinase BaeS